MFADEFNPRIVCADGFSMSVQAHGGSYCTPRQAEGPHTHMEGGFPPLIVTGKHKNS